MRMMCACSSKIGVGHARSIHRHWHRSAQSRLTRQQQAEAASMDWNAVQIIRVQHDARLWPKQFKP